VPLSDRWGIKYPFCIGQGTQRLIAFNGVGNLKQLIYLVKFGPKTWLIPLLKKRAAGNLFSLVAILCQMKW